MRSCSGKSSARSGGQGDEAVPWETDEGCEEGRGLREGFFQGTGEGRILDSRPTEASRFVRTGKWHLRRPGVRRRGDGQASRQNRLRGNDRVPTGGPELPRA